MRREDLQLALEQPVHLLTRLADRRCRCNHLRPHALALEVPGRQLVDRRLVEADHGAQGPADQVQLVLDDQVGRANEPVRLPRDPRLTARGGMSTRVLIVRGEESVALAEAAHPTEERLDFAPPRHLREFVDGRDHHRRQQPVDLFVDDDDRQPLVRRLRRRELTAAQCIRAEGIGSSEVVRRRLDDDIAPRLDLRAAPRAAAQLRRRAGSQLPPLVAASVLDGLLGVGRRIGCRSLANPQTDAERGLAPPLVALGQRLAANDLHRTQQRRCTLELLDRQQAQRVAHDHRQAVRVVQTAQ